MKLEIVNLLGQTVRTLVNEKMQSGFQTVVWNGLTSNGKKAESGVYLFKLTVNDQTQTRKMILMK